MLMLIFSGLKAAARTWQQVVGSFEIVYWKVGPLFGSPIELAFTSLTPSAFIDFSSKHSSLKEFASTLKAYGWWFWGCSNSAIGVDSSDLRIQSSYGDEKLEFSGAVLVILIVRDWSVWHLLFTFSDKLFICCLKSVSSKLAGRSNWLAALMRVSLKTDIFVLSIIPGKTKNNISD